jgi:ankyrin repeat protein
LFYCITPTERHAKCLEIAVENGAEVNNISKEGIPVLMFACETASENEDTCVLLMEKGAEPNGKQEVYFQSSLETFLYTFNRYFHWLVHRGTCM